MKTVTLSVEELAIIKVFLTQKILDAENAYAVAQSADDFGFCRQMMDRIVLCNNILEKLEN